MSAGRRNSVPYSILTADSIIEFVLCENFLAVYCGDEVLFFHFRVLEITVIVYLLNEYSAEFIRDRVAERRFYRRAFRC